MMASRNVSLIALLIAMFAASTTSARTFYCMPDTSEGTRSFAYDEYDFVRVKFVYVAFPSGGSHRVPNEITWSEHAAVVEQAREYIESQSNGHLVMTEDSGILCKPNNLLSPANPEVETWIVEYPPLVYRNCYLNSFDANYLSRHHPNWWTDERGWGSPIIGEVFEQITTAYPNPLTSPLYADVQNGEDKWSLWVVYLCNDVNSPFSFCDPDDPTPVGGTPDVKLIASEVANDTNDYFAGVEYAGASTSQIGSYVVNESQVEVFDQDGTLYVLMHEFVHTLGLADGPPALHTCCSEDVPDHRWCEERYYFGNLNIICQHYVPGFGLPPIPDPAYEDIPWRNVSDFTGQNWKDHKIYDLSDGGDICKFSLGIYPGRGDERFYFAYRGNGDEASPGRGLTIWHCVGNTVWDIESAVGLWEYADAHKTDFEFPWSLGWDEDEKDREQGYDNYDYWEWGNLPEEHRDRWLYGGHAGTEFDFFVPAAEIPNNKQSMFAFNTNPNSYGYDPDPTSHQFLRRRPQNQPNSLVVHVKEYGYDQIYGNYLLVDLLSAPYEELANPGTIDIEQLNANEYHITWDDPYMPGSTGNDNIINGVTLEYAIDGVHYRSITGDIPLSGNPREYVWTMSAVDVTDGPVGCLRATFYNSHTSYTNEDITEPFAVLGDHQQPFENILLPAGGTVFVEGDEMQIAWTDMNEPEEFSEIEIWLEAGDGGCMAPRRLDTPGELPDLNQRGYWLWNIGIYGSGCHNYRIRMRFISIHDEDGVPVREVFDSISNTFFIYPKVPVQFYDFTAEIRGDGFAVADTPTLYLPLRYDTDSALDIFVGKSDASGVLYGGSVTNDGNPTTPDYRRQDDPFGAPGVPEDVTGATWADYDGDAKPDLLISISRNPCRLFRNSGETYAYEIADVGPDIANLGVMRHSSWGDYNADGRVDLLLGGATGLHLLENIATESGPILQEVTPSGWSDASTNGGFVDVDLDGDLDIVALRLRVGSGGGSRTEMCVYENSGTDGYTYQDVTATILPNMCGTNVQAMEWADYDRDGDLDCVVAFDDGCNLELLVNENGTLIPADDAQVGNTIDGRVEELRIGDVDLDGWKDLVVTYVTESQTRCSVMINRGSTGNLLFTQDTASVNLGSVEGGIGLQLLDGDRDGDADLFYAKEFQPTEPGTYWHNHKSAGMDDPEHNWVGLQIPRDWQTEGARFEFREPGGVGQGALLGLRTIDCGGFARSREPAEVVIGLGEYNGDVDVTMTPIGGQSYTFTIGAANLNSYNTPPFDLVANSLRGTYTVGTHVNDTYWIFTWKTHFSTDGSRDRVIFDPSSVQGDCGNFPAEFNGGNAIVDPPVFSGGYWCHKISAPGTCWPGCSVRFWVESGEGSITTRSKYYGQRGILNMKVCPTQ